MATEEASRPAPGHREEPRRVPIWVLAAIPLALIIAALALLLAVGGETLGDRPGPPVEELAVERTVLRPGEIELSVRNVGPDAVDVEQVFVNDMYVDFTETPEDVGRLGGQTLTLDYLAGGLAAARDPADLHRRHDRARGRGRGRDAEADAGFYGLMALLGTYVGVIPVVLGMLFLPFLAQVREHWIRIFMAFTIGLLGFLAVDAYLEGNEIAEEGSGAFGGLELLFIGAGVAFLSLVALDRYLAGRRKKARAPEDGAFHLSLSRRDRHRAPQLRRRARDRIRVRDRRARARRVPRLRLRPPQRRKGLAIVAPLAKGADPRSSRWARWGDRRRARDHRRLRRRLGLQPGSGRAPDRDRDRGDRAGDRAARPGDAGWRRPSPVPGERGRHPRGRRGPVRPGS